MGVLCLTAGLWWTGRIGGTPIRQTAVQTVEERQPSADSRPPSKAGPVRKRAESHPPSRLAMPIGGVDPSKLSSDFDEVRDGRRHEALDIMAPRGTPVMAVAQGNVVKLFPS